MRPLPSAPCPSAPTPRIRSTRLSPYSTEVPFPPMTSLTPLPPGPSVGAGFSVWSARRTREASCKSYKVSERDVSNIPKKHPSVGHGGTVSHVCSPHHETRRQSIGRSKSLLGADGRGRHVGRIRRKAQRRVSPQCRLPPHRRLDSPVVARISRLPRLPADESTNGSHHRGRRLFRPHVGSRGTYGHPHGRAGSFRRGGPHSDDRIKYLRPSWSRLWRSSTSKTGRRKITTFA